MLVDLHTHSNCSDGELSPSELARLAAENGIGVWALTDHDTIAGVVEARTESAKAGIKFVPGIELNVEWKTGEFHLLGLSIQPSERLAVIIDYLQNERDRRNKKIFEKMKDAGFNVDYGEMRQFIKSQGNIGRPHIAEYLVYKNIVRTRQEAFDRYIGKNRPLYDEIAGVPLADAVRAVKSSGGVPVIAHPLSLHIAWGKIGELFAFFKNKGVEGIEAWHPTACVKACKRLEALARKTGLFITAGSDFHGKAARSDSCIGTTAGNMPIDERFLPDVLR
ncbi:MAG: PHP domain-containing protein [Treponemataceae bacterium]|nr:MAG: PHP domain-containing protein [Treponemataceae bacterium]